MPSPKAVLRDIHDLKLDPKQAHSKTKRSGRLRHVVSATVLQPLEVKKVDPELALFVNVVEDVDQHQQVEDPQSMETMPKKKGFGKKKEDKKPEDPTVS